MKRRQVRRSVTLIETKKKKNCKESPYFMKRFEDFSYLADHIKKDFTLDYDKLHNETEDEDISCRSRSRSKISNANEEEGDEEGCTRMKFNKSNRKSRFSIDTDSSDSSPELENKFPFLTDTLERVSKSRLDRMLHKDNDYDRLQTLNSSFLINSSDDCSNLVSSTMQIHIDYT